MSYNKEYIKKWKELNKDKYREYQIKWRAEHREEMKEYMKAYYAANKESEKDKARAYYEAHKEERKASMKIYHQAHAEELKIKKNNDVNSLGQSKSIIRAKSKDYLIKYGQRIEGYQIHHCCTYAEPYKFIYCSKEMHRLIHAYLRQHNIDADSDHYQYIKHLLDDTVIKYNVE